jgi:DNA polymerase-1
MSKDKNLIKAFNLGKDIHTSTAAEIFDVGYEEVDENLRRKAKAINFGIIYGMTEFGLKNRLKITEQEAREYIELYFSRYPGVKNYLGSLVSKATEKGYAETMFGRRRYIKELSSSNFNIKNLGERLAINTPIQGSAADIMKLSTILLYKNLKKEHIQSNIVLHVHDEIVLEFREEDTDKIKKIVKNSLENCMRLEVKLRVDLKFGSSWYI